MDKLMERIQARCQDCGATYSVPEARTYTCKSCEGSVRPIQVEGTAQSSGIASMVPCSACEALNPNGAHFCEECGGVLGASPAKPIGEEQMAARRQALGELKQGFRRINAVTWLYRIAAPGYALGTLFAVFALANGDAPLARGLQTVGVFVVLAAALMMGAIQVHFHPRACTASIAILGTLSVLVSLASAGALSHAFLWSVGWTVLFWIAVSPAYRFHAMTRQHPDLYVEHEVQGLEVRRTVRGRSAKDRHERLQRLLHRATRKAWKFSALASGGFLIATTLAAYVVTSELRAPHLDPVLEQFRSAWNASDIDQLAAFFPEEQRATETSRLAAMITDHGWEPWPEIPERTVEGREARVTVEYPLGEDTLSARWNLDAQRWYLVRLDPPTPPFAPTFERFKLAWERSDADAIAAFYPPSFQAEMQASLADKFEARSWSTLPAIEEERVVQEEEDLMSTTFVLPSGGEVATKWQFAADGRWNLQAFRLPSKGRSN